MSEKLRGHAIEERNGEWFFCDTGEPTASTYQSRPCGHCGKHNTPEGHDACLGTLPGVISACCGHGTPEHSYAIFENGMPVRGFKLDFPHDELP